MGASCSAYVLRGVEMDQREMVKPIHDAIFEGSKELQEIFFERWAQWYSFAVSDVMLLTDGCDVQFADAVVTGDDPSHAYSVRIAIFTEQLLISVTAEVNDDGERHTTRACNRADLKSLEVAAGTGALGNTWPANWPGTVRVKLDYGDAEPLRLPGGKSADGAQYARLTALLPSLIADLTATQGAR